jgi:arylsulfatase A-like enzyme
MDTVRADHLSCYGYHRDTTPNIDAFAKDARLYQNVLASSSWTLPTHASMFTGLSAREHGVNWQHRFLDERFPTLAERLTGQGYQTIGLTSNPIVSSELGFSRGFGSFDAFHYGAIPMHSKLAHWFTRQYDPQKPFFLFMNYIEAHSPYQPSPDAIRFASREVWKRWLEVRQFKFLHDYTMTGRDSLSSHDIAELESLYDDELAYVDARIGEFLAFLKSSGLDDNTVVIITADHGELFGEHHCMGHDYALYEPLVRVPLIARCPQRLAPGVEEKLIQSHDVYPTILEMANVAWDPTPGGTCRSLLRPLSDDRIGISEYNQPMLSILNNYVEAHPNIDFSRFLRPLSAIQRGNMKLIRRLQEDPIVECDCELYDLAADPLERQDLVEERPDLACELSDLLDSWGRCCKAYVADPHSQRRQAMPPSVSVAMRGLGYIE